MSSLKLHREDRWELDPIPFPGRVVSRVGRWDPQHPQHHAQPQTLAHARRPGFDAKADAGAAAERALLDIERHLGALAGSIGIDRSPDRPRAA